MELFMSTHSHYLLYQLQLHSFKKFTLVIKRNFTLTK